MAKKKDPNSRRVNPEWWFVLSILWRSEGCSATKNLDFLRSHLFWFRI